MKINKLLPFILLASLPLVGCGNSQTSPSAPVVPPEPTIELVEGDYDFTFSQMGLSNAEEVTQLDKHYISILFEQGDNSNTPKYYDSGTAIRAYGGNSFTVYGTFLSKIVFQKSGNDITASSGTLSGTTWTNSEDGDDYVTFTVSGTSGHTKLVKLTVTCYGYKDAEDGYPGGAGGEMDPEMAADFQDILDAAFPGDGYVAVDCYYGASGEFYAEKVLSSVPSGATTATLATDYANTIKGSVAMQEWTTGATAIDSEDLPEGVASGHYVGLEMISDNALSLDVDAYLTTDGEYVIALCYYYYI